MTAITGSHFIAGQPNRQAAPSFASVNPRTRAQGEICFADATAEEIHRAVSAAADAYEQTHRFSAARLADFLDAAAQAILDLGDELLQTADAETALGLPRLTGERGRTTGQLQAFARLLREGSYVNAIIDTAQPDRQPAPRPDIRRMLLPIGPVAVFAASNFPFAFSVAGGDTASAWAAGCPVVVKAHPGHPATSELVATAIYRAIEATGFPQGWFSLLHGTSIEVGQRLIQHPKLEAVGFTGSLRAGRALFDTAAKRERPIPVYAEMGSVNPVVILPGALATRAEALAEGFVGSVTLGTGQFCTNPGLALLVKSPEADAFIESVRAKMEAREAGVLLNPAIERGLVTTVESTVARGTVQTLTGGAALGGEACRYANTVLTAEGIDFIHDAALQTEHFGPVTLIVRCDSIDQLEEALRSLHGNLTGTLHAETSDLEQAGRLAEVLREKVGRLIWNGFPTGVEVVHAMQHGGPYPATTAPATTSVGMTAVQRFLRPVAYQNMPEALLPPALHNANPLGIWRIVNNEWTQAAI